MIKRRALTALYSALLLAYLGFVLYFLTLRPGGLSGNQAIIWAITGFASGGMMMMAIYALTLHLFRRVEKASLYFALFCVGTGARFLVMEGSVTLMGLMPGMTYNAALCIRYPAIGLSIIGVVSFIFEIFAAPKHRRRLPYLNAVAAAVSALSTATAYSVSNTLAVNLSFLLLTIFVDAYCVFVVVTSRGLRENKLHILYLASLLLYAVTSVFSALLTDWFPHLTVIANTVFVIVHIVLLSDRYARAITSVERTNEALEEKVAERTAELLIANNHLAERNVILDGLNKTKTEFLQDMSHEMRNPLAVVAIAIDAAYSQVTKEKGDLETAADALADARDETQRIGRMVDGMITLAAMSDSANRERVDFATLLRRAADAYRIVLGREEGAFRVDVAADMPDVFIEKDRFAQVISNLLKNASEHTPDGWISLSARYDGSYIAVSVADNGSGILPELLPRVFERGVSGSGGTGYGLHICKSIVEAHGGTIEVNSQPRNGTTVTFTVPVYGGQDEVRAR